MAISALLCRGWLNENDSDPKHFEVKFSESVVRG